MENLRRLLEIAKLESKLYNIWQTCPETPENLAKFPIKVGPGVWSGVLVEDEVQVHLGDFSTPSTSFILATDNPESVHNGQITLVGPDLPAITLPTIPFALGIIMCLKEVNSEKIKALNRYLQVRDEIEGFMQRSQRGDPRYLLGKVLFQRGVSFEHLGRAFLHLFHTKFPHDIQKCEIVLLTALPSVINEMKQFREQAVKEIAKIWDAKIQQVSKLRPDCDFEWECEACEYQKICEELRDIIRLRDNGKPTTDK